MLASLAVGLKLSRERQQRLSLSSGQRWAVAGGAFCGAMLAAKLPFLLTHPSGALSLAAWLDNGKTIMGGLVGGYLGVELAKWLMGVRVKTGDSFAVPVAAAVGTGRLACLFAGCCYGTVTSLPWGVDFGDGHRRHPTQAYEAAFHLGAAVVLSRLERQGLFRRQLIKLYILGYLAYRFMTEFIRPEARVLGALTAYQIAALLLAPLFVTLWIRDRHAG